MEGAESVKDFTAKDVTAEDVELLEGKNGFDNAWYPCCIKLTSKDTMLKVQFQGLQDSDWLNLSRFSTFQDVFDRVRLISPQLDASTCVKVCKGQLVCGLKQVAQGLHKWFDASVVERKERLHTNEKTQDEKCACTFIIMWNDEPDRWKKVELPASSIRVPLSTTRAVDNPQLKMLLNAVSTRIPTMASNILGDNQTKHVRFQETASNRMGDNRTKHVRFQEMASNKMGDNQTKHVQADDGHGQGASPGLEISAVRQDTIEEATNRMGDNQTKHVQADDDHGQGASPGLQTVNATTKLSARRKVRSSAAHVGKGREPARPKKAWTLRVSDEELHGVPVESRLGGKALSFGTRLRLKSDRHVQDMQQLALVPASLPAGLAADVGEGNIHGVSGGVVPKLQAQPRSRLKKSSKSMKSMKTKILTKFWKSRIPRESKGSKKPEQSLPIEDIPIERDRLCSGSWPIDSVLRIENVEKGLAPHEARIFLQSMFDNVGTVILSPPVEDDVPGASGFVVFRDSTSAAFAGELLTAEICLVASRGLRPWFVRRAEETDGEKEVIASTATAQFKDTSFRSQERAATSPLRWFTAVKENEYKVVLKKLRLYRKQKMQYRALVEGLIEQEEAMISRFRAEQQSSCDSGFVP